MLNQLEQVPGSFFRVNSILPASVGLRLHKGSLEELAKTDNFFKSFAATNPKSYQGVYRISTIRLA